MNTNILATVVALTVTNWLNITVPVDDNEMQLGLVQTNMVAHLVYEGKTNEVVLKTIVSDRAVFRASESTFKVKPESIITWPWPDVEIITNNWYVRP